MKKFIAITMAIVIIAIAALFVGLYYKLIPTEEVAGGAMEVITYEELISNQNYDEFYDLVIAEFYNE